MLAAIVGLCLLTACCQANLEYEGYASDIDMKKPTSKKFFNLLNSNKNSGLVLVFRNGCDQTCLEELSVIEENKDHFQMIDGDLKVYRINITDLLDVQDQLILDTDHGVYYLYRGESVRVDTNDLSKDMARNLLTDMTAIIQRRVALIEDWETVRDLNHTNKVLHLYYGDTSEPEFKEITIASKLTERDIYLLQHEEIAEKFKIESPGMYTYDKEDNDSYRMRGTIKRSSVLKFLLASSRPVPQAFDPDAVTHSIHFNMPVLFFYARTDFTNQTMKNVLLTTEHLTKSYFHVYQLTDKQDPDQSLYFDECKTPFNYGYTICILRARHGRIMRYIYDKKVINFERFNSFLEAYIDKKLQPYLHSEEIKEPQSGNIKNLNRESFQELYEIHTKDNPHFIVIFFYEDDSIESQSLMGIFEALSNLKLPSSLPLTFARINMSRNELLEISHIKTPSIHFTTGYDDTEVRVYEGVATLDALKKFVEESQDHFLKIYPPFDIDL